MTSGIAKIADNRVVAWSPIVDHDKCYLFADGVVPDPLPEGFVLADSLEDAATPADLKQAEVEAWWQAVESEGYCVTSFGPEIGFDTESRQALNDGVTLLREMLAIPALGLTDESPFPGGVDRHGLPLVVGENPPTIAQFRQMAVEAGLMYQAGWTLLRVYRARIASGDLEFMPGEDELADGLNLA